MVGEVEELATSVCGRRAGADTTVVVVEAPTTAAATEQLQEIGAAEELKRMRTARRRGG
eukprot:SAG11_NODE_3499_length_2409_cov_9.797403_2_plen_59_part_00